MESRLSSSHSRRTQQQRTTTAVALSPHSDAAARRHTADASPLFRIAAYVSRHARRIQPLLLLLIGCSLALSIQLTHTAEEFIAPQEHRDILLDAFRRPIIQEQFRPTREAQSAFAASSAWFGGPSSLFPLLSDLPLPNRYIRTLNSLPSSRWPPPYRCSFSNRGETRAFVAHCLLNTYFWKQVSQYPTLLTLDQRKYDAMERTAAGQKICNEALIIDVRKPRIKRRKKKSAKQSSSPPSASSSSASSDIEFRRLPTRNPGRQLLNYLSYMSLASHLGGWILHHHFPEDQDEEEEEEETDSQSHSSSPPPSSPSSSSSPIPSRRYWSWPSSSLRSQWVFDKVLSAPLSDAEREERAWAQRNGQSMTRRNNNNVNRVEEGTFTFEEYMQNQQRTDANSSVPLPLPSRIVPSVLHSRSPLVAQYELEEWMQLHSYEVDARWIRRDCEENSKVKQRVLKYEKHVGFDDDDEEEGEQIEPNDDFPSVKSDVLALARSMDSFSSAADAAAIAAAAASAPSPVPPPPSSPSPPPPPPSAPSRRLQQWDTLSVDVVADVAAAPTQLPLPSSPPLPFSLPKENKHEEKKDKHQQQKQIKKQKKQQKEDPLAASSTPPIPSVADTERVPGPFEKRVQRMLQWKEEERAVVAAAAAAAAHTATTDSYPPPPPPSPPLSFPPPPLSSSSSPPPSLFLSLPSWHLSSFLDPAMLLLLEIRLWLRHTLSLLLYSSVATQLLPQWSESSRAISAESFAAAVEKTMRQDSCSPTISTGFDRQTQGDPSFYSPLSNPKSFKSYAAKREELDVDAKGRYESPEAIGNKYWNKQLQWSIVIKQREKWRRINEQNPVRNEMKKAEQNNKNNKTAIFSRSKEDELFYASFAAPSPSASFRDPYSSSPFCSLGVPPQFAASLVTLDEVFSFFHRIYVSLPLSLQQSLVLTLFIDADGLSSSDLQVLVDQFLRVNIHPRLEINVPLANQVQQISSSDVQMFMCVEHEQEQERTKGEGSNKVSDEGSCALASFFRSEPVKIMFDTPSLTKLYPYVRNVYRVGFEEEEKKEKEGSIGRVTSPSSVPSSYFVDLGSLNADNSSAQALLLRDLYPHLPGARMELWRMDQLRTRPIEIKKEFVDQRTEKEAMARLTRTKVTPAHSSSSSSSPSSPPPALPYGFASLISSISRVYARKLQRLRDGGLPSFLDNYQESFPANLVLTPTEKKEQQKQRHKEKTGGKTTTATKREKSAPVSADAATKRTSTEPKRTPTSPPPTLERKTTKTISTKQSSSPPPPKKKK